MKGSGEAGEECGHMEMRGENGRRGGWRTQLPWRADSRPVAVTLRRQAGFRGTPASCRFDEMFAGK